MDSCICVLDHDPSNSEFSLRLKDFGWNPSFLLGCDSIPDDLVRLKAQVLGHSVGGYPKNSDNYPNTRMSFQHAQVQNQGAKRL
jgi:hypothetical protein